MWKIGIFLAVLCIVSIPTYAFFGPSIMLTGGPVLNTPPLLIPPVGAATATWGDGTVSTWGDGTVAEWSAP